MRAERGEFALTSEPEGVDLSAVHAFLPRAYHADVYVLEAYRGQRLVRWLVDSILKHPDLQTLRRFSLVWPSVERRGAKARGSAERRDVENHRPAPTSLCRRHLVP